MYLHNLQQHLVSIIVLGFEIQKKIKHLNQNSLKFINNVKLESSMINSLKSEYYQFVRKGYFKMDKDSDKDNLVFNQIVNLRDSWKKHTK